MRILLGVFLTILGCNAEQKSQQSEKAPRDEVPGLDLVEAKPIVRFGVISRYNPVVMYEAYQPLMDYLTSNTAFRYELKLGRNYGKDVRFLETGVTQVAFLGVVTYLEAHARFGAVPILKTLNRDGKPFYYSIVVARTDSDIQTLEDLRGRSFCFASVHSTSSNLFGRLALI